ncbi:MAG TPA: hypothetical protein VN668_07935 [Stellaceae bacterium]|nr:hypothetical protein [Stellaceae bacterium]
MHEAESVNQHGQKLTSISDQCWTWENAGAATRSTVLSRKVSMISNALPVSERDDTLNGGIDAQRPPEARSAPADVIGNAVKIMRIATGEESEELPPEARSAAADLESRRGEEAALPDR